MTESHGSYIQRFNGENFHLWKRQMEIFARNNKLIKYLDGSCQRPLTKFASWDEKDEQAQAFIMKGLELSQLRRLSDCHTAEKMWTRLSAVHGAKSDQSMQVLLEQFMNYKMGDNIIKVADYVANISQLADQIKDLGMPLAEPLVIAKILASLPPVFDSVRTSWYSVPKAEQSVEKLANHLSNEVAVLKGRSDKAVEKRTEDVFFAGGNSTADQRNSNGANNKRKPGLCDYCRKSGHWLKECRARIHDEKYGGHQHHSGKFNNFRGRGYRNYGQNHGYHQGHGYVVEGNNNNQGQHGSQGQCGHHDMNSCQSSMFCVETGAECFSMEREENLWFADSAATEHMTFREDWCTILTFYADKSYKMRMGNGDVLYAKGRGDVVVRVMHGSNAEVEHVITNVLLVPKLKKNLLSVSKATLKGMSTFEQEERLFNLIKEET